MGPRRKRFAPYTTQCRNQLETVSEKDQRAFRNWLDGFVKDRPRRDNLDELPSSQIPCKSSFVNPDRAQLFAIIDTCSIVRFRNEFIDFITNLRKCYNISDCPVKLIVPIVVLEELDKCNRPVKKRGLDQRRVNGQEQRQQQQQQQQQQFQQRQYQPRQFIKDEYKPSRPEEGYDRELLISDLLQNDSPPRQFMRFIEQEMRDGLLLIGDLDPCKLLKLPPFEIINHDDRILESSLRAMKFIGSQPHHSDTRVVLVTEDNIFKAKASTFEVASFRWREFIAKYHNFGKKNCVSTPTLRKSCNTNVKQDDKDVLAALLLPISDNKPALKSDPLKSPPALPLDSNMFNFLTQPKLEKPAPHITTSRKVDFVCENGNEKRSTSMKIQATRKSRDTITDVFTQYGKERAVIADIVIVKEVINLN